jgi:hypothetical protein
MEKRENLSVFKLKNLKLSLVLMGKIRGSGGKFPFQKKGDTS